MGQYILATVCHKLTIPKEALIKNNIEKEEMLKEISKSVNINCYNIEEDDLNYTFKAKEEIFTPKNLAGFIKEQGQIFKEDDEDNDIEEVYNKVSTLQTYEEIVRLADEKPYQSFQSFKEIYRVRCGFWKDFIVKADTIIFFMEGKADLECYSRLFTYMKNLIKKNSEFEISEMVEIFLG